MADSKITALTAISTVDPTADPLVIVDVSDTSMAASGTTKKSTINQLLGAGGTATLASATITGDLTVDTSTLKVDSANNRVGIGTATPVAGSTLHIVDSDPTILLQGNQLSGTRYNRIKFANQPGSINYEIYGGYYGTGGLYVADYTNNGILFGVSNTPGTFTERYKIDSTGVATWSNVGGVAGTAMTLNATGLGVGTSPSYKIHSAVTSGFAGAFRSSTAVAGGILCGNSLADLIVGVDASGNGRLTADTSKYLGLGSGGINDRVILDSSGNFGVGVTPSAWGAGYKALQLGNGLSLMGSPLNGTIAGNAWFDGTNWKYITANPATLYYASFGANGSHVWSISSGVPSAGGNVSLTNAMTLDASGNLLVGTTASGGQNGFCVLRPLSGGVVATTAETAHNFGALTGSTYATFLYATTAIGSITQNGTTGVLYNINSDYRLKESVAPLSGGLARVNALKPSIYKWKSDGSSGEGFLAHELAEVVPFAVTGEKDAVNEDGSIKSQGIDMSRVVPILVAAIQELTARVQTLETR